MTVNHDVVGSSPTSGANKINVLCPAISGLFFYIRAICGAELYRKRSWTAPTFREQNEQSADQTLRADSTFFSKLNRSLSSSIQRVNPLLQIGMTGEQTLQGAVLGRAGFGL